MAIDRTNFNALVDETGSGNGSIWDKAAIEDVLLDPIDAALLSTSALWTVISNTDTGTQNNWAPTGLSGHTLIKWNGASDLTVTGLAGGTAGQNVIFENVSATATRLATFNHAAGGSSVANRFTNVAVSGATPCAQAGRMWYQHDGTDWQLMFHDQGAWITRAYAGTDFTASTGTWTVDSGDVQIFRYWLKGRTLLVAWAIGTTSVSTTPATLLIKIPGGFTAAATGAQSGPHFYKDSGGAYTFGESWISPAALTVITLYPAGFGSATWTAATNTTATYGQMPIEVT